MNNTLPISKLSAISFKFESTWIIKINNNISPYRALAYIMAMYFYSNLLLSISK